MSQKLILLVLLFLKVRWTFFPEKLWFLLNSTFRLIELEILSGDDGRADLYFDTKKENILLSTINGTYYQGNIRFTNKARHYLIPPLQYHLKTITVICFEGIFYQLLEMETRPSTWTRLTFPFASDFIVRSTLFDPSKDMFPEKSFMWLMILENVEKLLFSNFLRLQAYSRNTRSGPRLLIMICLSKFLLKIFTNWKSGKSLSVFLCWSELEKFCLIFNTNMGQGQDKRERERDRQGGK